MDLLERACESILSYVWLCVCCVCVCAGLCVWETGHHILRRNNIYSNWLWQLYAFHYSKASTIGFLHLRKNKIIHSEFIGCDSSCSFFGFVFVSNKKKVRSIGGEKTIKNYLFAIDFSLYIIIYKCSILVVLYSLTKFWSHHLRRQFWWCDMCANKSHLQLPSRNKLHCFYFDRNYKEKEIHIRKSHAINFSHDISSVLVRALAMCVK